MRIVIVAFDALDHVLVEQYFCNKLQQSVHGITNLDPYIAGGGNLDCITDEIFATFITGKVPDIHKVKLPIDLTFSLRGKFPTIFDFCDSVAVDVPSWNRNPQHHLFQERVGWFLGRESHREAINMDHDKYWERVNQEKETLIPDLKEYIAKNKLARIKTALEQEKKLTMIYFWYTDIWGHVQKANLQDMYNHASDLLSVIKYWAGKDTLVMVMSDHGMIEGHHRPEAFWSLSKPLLNQGDNISIIDWYNKINEWLKV